MSAEYAFRVTGKLTSALKTALRPLEVAPTANETVLVADVTDRAELHGLIARIEALGLDLVGLQRLSRSVEDPSGDHLSPSAGNCGTTGAATGHVSRSRR
jgi:hypothetical protein